MSDRDNKTTKPEQKVLSNSLRLKTPHNVKSRQNVSNILNRLPFLRQLNESQNQLLSVTPIWQKWCADQANSIITEFASPANIDGEILTIYCTKSSTATLLKHQQTSLLEALQKSGYSQIKRLKVQMTLSQTSLQNQSDENSTEPRDLKSQQHAFQQTGTSSLESTLESTLKSTKAAWPKPSASAIKSVEATQSLIKNEHLAAALKRLAETLKKAT
ncbi:MAG: hypothetical protein ACJAYF_002447 [Arenicella sp.]|jgi:hypothetical protein